jgi:pimeloyl-ACP methyl ester carboxylesterase
MKIIKNKIIAGKSDKPILLDIGYQLNGTPKPIVVFAHGFKGFKDWGHFNIMMEHFIKEGFAFAKFNFSHNGGTVEQPIDFPDLEAFGNNNFTKELADLRTVIDYLESLEIEEINSQEIYLIGHSRGGGISIIAANEDDRIKKLITWAAVSDLTNRFTDEQLAYWKQQGVIYVENSRTNQQMPMYYQIAEDTLNNIDRFSIVNAAAQLTIPHLIIHGADDKTVPVEEAKSINEWNKNAELHIIEQANHSFGAAHPFNDVDLPKDVQLVLKKTLAFIKK